MPEMLRRTYTPPPLGLRPKFIADDCRIDEIASAIDRYLRVRMAIPVEWLTEYNEIAESRKNREADHG